MKARIASIQANSVVDGPGVRTVVFFQGCSIHCPGCQNKHLWDPSGGTEIEVTELAERIAEIGNPQVTISGGEPFQQPEQLARLVSILKYRHNFHIIVYTGFTWEVLRTLCNPIFLLNAGILSNVDVLVDGQYVKSLDDDCITYRGSRNQRPIDVQASRRANQVITLDWDAPEVVITQDGNAFLPIGMVAEMGELGIVQPTRMCGQTKSVQ